MMPSSPKPGSAKIMAPRKEADIPEYRGSVVSLNITETRTENFLGELKRRGFQAIPYRTNSRSSTFHNLFAFAKSVRKADFVLCGGMVPSQIPWLLAARLLGRPCILDYPMDLTEWPFSKAFRWRCYVWITLRCASCVLTIKSREYIVKKFGLSARRVKFLESCPDPAVVDSAHSAEPRFRRQPDAILVCWSGGHEHHRLERFMPTFQRLIELVQNVELLVIADPSKPSVIESTRYARSAGFEDRVHVLPVIKPPADFYATIAQSDIWISTLGDDSLQGRQELRMELMEAGLLARAVVSARTPALVEHGLVDGKEILFIDPSDPAGSAQKIAALALDPKARRQLGEHLRARVIQEFSLKEAIDNLLDCVAQNGTAISARTGVAPAATGG